MEASDAKWLLTCEGGYQYHVRTGRAEGYYCLECTWKSQGFCLCPFWRCVRVMEAETVLGRQNDDKG